MAEPMLIVVPNKEGLELLSEILEEHKANPDGDIPVWETTINLRITPADLQRFMYGNGDLCRIVFWIDEEGHADGVAVPDPEVPMSPFS